MKFWLIGLALSRGLDAASTCQAFAAGRVEANPLMPRTCAGTIGVQAGLSLGQVLLLTHYAKEHPRAAKWLAGITISIETGAVLQNSRR
mgnify:CR=1 FL=1